MPMRTKKIKNHLVPVDVFLTEKEERAMAELSGKSIGKCGAASHKNGFSKKEKERLK